MKALLLASAVILGVACSGAHLSKVEVPDELGEHVVHLVSALGEREHEAHRLHRAGPAARN